MFGIFKKSNSDPVLLKWSKQYEKDHVKIQDKEKAFGQKLIFYGSCVFIQRDARKLNLKRIKSDKTIIELSIFLLFLVDYALHSKNVAHRTELMRKFIGEYVLVFSTYLDGINATEIINSRLNLYGEQTRKAHGSVMQTGVKLLHELINSSNQFKDFQYYGSRSNFIIEYDPIYSATIVELTSPYIAMLSSILEMEIDQMIDDSEDDSWDEDDDLN